MFLFTENASNCKKLTQSRIISTTILLIHFIFFTIDFIVIKSRYVCVQFYERSHYTFFEILVCITCRPIIWMRVYQCSDIITTSQARANKWNIEGSEQSSLWDVVKKFRPLTPSAPVCAKANSTLLLYSFAKVHILEKRVIALSSPLILRISSTKLSLTILSKFTTTCWLN